MSAGEDSSVGLITCSRYVGLQVVHSGFFLSMMVVRWWTLKSICYCLGVLDINEGIGLEACCKPLYTLTLSEVKVGKLPEIESTLHSIRRNVNINLFTRTEHQGAQRTHSEVVVHSRIELEFENVGF